MTNINISMLGKTYECYKETQIFHRFNGFH